jgi:hypothetical protein
VFAFIPQIKGKQVKFLHGHAAVIAELLSWEGSGMALSGHWKIREGDKSVEA